MPFNGSPPIWDAYQPVEGWLMLSVPVGCPPARTCHIGKKESLIKNDAGLDPDMIWVSMLLSQALPPWANGVMPLTIG